jgi:hypothetical protein
LIFQIAHGTGGWTEPSATQDIYEAHPYFYVVYTPYVNSRFTRPEKGPLWEWMNKPQIPDWYSGKVGVPIKYYDKHPILVNEYSWTWLFRQNAIPPFTSKLIYDVMVGKNSSAQQRRYFRAYELAAETEYWRSNRKLAGVMFFNMLETSRLGGSVTATAPDDMIDVQNVVFESMLVKRMTDALSPVGIMIDRWEDHFKAGEEITCNLYAINDTYEKWTGTIELILESNKESMVDKKYCSIEPVGKTGVNFKIKLPVEKGKYKLKARLKFKDHTIESIRDFEI